MLSDRGAKRKIKHTDGRRKAFKLEDVCLQLGGLDICNNSPTGGKNVSEVQEGLSITQSIAGWNGRRTKPGIISPKARNKKVTGMNDSQVQKGPKVNTSKRSPPSSKEKTWCLKGHQENAVLHTTRKETTCWERY